MSAHTPNTCSTRAAARRFATATGQLPESRKWSCTAPKLVASCATDEVIVAYTANGDIVIGGTTKGNLSRRWEFMDAHALVSRDQKAQCRAFTQELKWGWGGDLKGHMKDFMHFSFDGQ